MDFQIEERSRGVKVRLLVQIDAQALGLPCEAAQSGATFGPDQTQFLDECLDSAHTELLRLLRQARYVAERSLVEREARRLRDDLAAG